MATIYYVDSAGRNTIGPVALLTDTGRIDVLLSEAQMSAVKAGSLDLTADKNYRVTRALPAIPSNLNGVPVDRFTVTVAER